MKKNFKINTIYSHRAILGECPLWDPNKQLLYWIDIVKPSIHSLHPVTRAHREIPLSKEIGSIGLYEDGSLLCALSNGFAKLDFTEGKLHSLIEPLGDRKDVMFNDGHSDIEGRFWVGTKDMQEKLPKAVLYCLEANKEYKKITDGFTIVNGVTWNPDNTILYLCDSPKRTIYQYDFNAKTGEISNQKVFAKIAKTAGYPDGLAVDSEGYVWNAHYDGWQLTRYTPNGKVDCVVHMPVQCPTDCCFGGQDLTTLFITSASHNLSDVELKKGPLAGQLFAIETNVKGLPPYRFKG